MVSSILDRAIATTVELQKQHKLHHRCIDTAHILVAVLKTLGRGDAFVLTVSVTATNARMATELTNSQDRDHAEANAKFLLNSEQIRQCGPIGESEWGGHLVVILPRHFEREHALVDLTINQLNNPEKQIQLYSELRIPVRDEFLGGGCEVHVLENRCWLRYEAHPTDKSYFQPEGNMPPRLRMLIWDAREELNR